MADWRPVADEAANLFGTVPGHYFCAARSESQVSLNRNGRDSLRNALGNYRQLQFLTFVNLWQIRESILLRKFAAMIDGNAPTWNASPMLVVTKVCDPRFCITNGMSSDTSPMAR
jgi:hypothetical protein